MAHRQTQVSEPGLLDVIGCGDIGNVILDKCGVICLAKLSTACKASRETVQQYNRHTKRIFPVRCGGHDHEFYTFWKEYDKERVARALSEHPISNRNAYRCATVWRRWAYGQRLATHETAEPILHEVRV